MKTTEFNVTELNINDLKKINGGNPFLIFVAGAIVGGMVYDVYKAASLALIKAQVEHPEYYDGPVHSQR
jgi:hypothetical protein